MCHTPGPVLTFKLLGTPRRVRTGIRRGPSPEVRSVWFAPRGHRRLLHLLHLQLDPHSGHNVTNKDVVPPLYTYICNVICHSPDHPLLAPNTGQSTEGRPREGCPPRPAGPRRGAWTPVTAARTAPAPGVPKGDGAAGRGGESGSEPQCRLVHARFPT